MNARSSPSGQYVVDGNIKVPNFPDFPDLRDFPDLEKINSHIGIPNFLIGSNGIVYLINDWSINLNKYLRNLEINSSLFINYNDIILSQKEIPLFRKAFEKILIDSIEKNSKIKT